MKWLGKEPELSDMRIVERFLLLPKTLENGHQMLETKWLKRCRVWQIYSVDVLGERKWFDVSWVD